MELPILMNAEDFENQQRPCGPRSIEFWVAKEPLATPIGKFNIELNEAPDAQLLVCADERRNFVTNNCEEILDVIYDSYCQAA
jgi:hypothetical protein